VTGAAVVPDGATARTLIAGMTIAVSGAFWAYDGWIT